MRATSILLLPLLWLGSACQSTGEIAGDISWVNVNEAPDTWTAGPEGIVCTGKIQSTLRSAQVFGNYELEFECRREPGNGDAAVILHAAELPSTGSAIPDGIRFSIGTEQEGFIQDKWNHYRIKSNSKAVQLSVNGGPATVISAAEQRKGHITFSSGGAAYQVRNIHIKATSATAVQKKFRPLFNGHDLSQWEMKPGHAGHWTAGKGVIDYDGNSREKDKCLWSKKAFRDFVLVADVRLTRPPEMARTPVILPNGDNARNADGSNQEVEMLYNGDTGIYLRGESKSQVNIGNRYIGSGEIYGYRVDKRLPPEVRAGVTPKIKADNPPGEWNRFVITMKGERVTVEVNGETVIDNALLPGIPEQGPIALQDDHASDNRCQFANVYIMEIN